MEREVTILQWRNDELNITHQGLIKIYVRWNNEVSSELYNECYSANDTRRDLPVVQNHWEQIQ